MNYNEVYIIEYDNCELYGDHQSWLGEVFDTEELAKRFLESKGFIKDIECHDCEYLKKVTSYGVVTGHTGARIIKRKIHKTLT